METVHLLSRNVQIIAQSWINICVVSPDLNDGCHYSWHGLIEGIRVLWGDMSPDLERHSFQTSDLNKQTL